MIVCLTCRCIHVWAFLSFLSIFNGILREFATALEAWSNISVANAPRKLNLIDMLIDMLDLHIYNLT